MSGSLKLKIALVIAIGICGAIPRVYKAIEEKKKASAIQPMTLTPEQRVAMQSIQAEISQRAQNGEATNFDLVLLGLSREEYEQQMESMGIKKPQNQPAEQIDSSEENDDSDEFHPTTTP